MISQTLKKGASRILLPDNTTAEVVMRIKDPVIIVIDNVLTPAECAWIRDYSRPVLTASKSVRVEETFDDDVNSDRTSSTAYLNDRLEGADGDVIRHINDKIMYLCGLPHDHGEVLQVQHYTPGQRFIAHDDWFGPEYIAEECGGVNTDRVSTMIVYLNEVEAGGETLFVHPKLTLHPKPGRAVYFEYGEQYMKDRSEMDGACTHAGLKVRKGEKFVVTKWNRATSYTE